METKNWSGLELPAHLDYEQAVTHVLDHLHRCCGLLDMQFDREAIEPVIRNWGLAMAVQILLETIRGREEEWWKLFYQHDTFCKLMRNSSRYA